MRCWCLLRRLSNASFYVVLFFVGADHRRQHRKVQVSVYAAGSDARRLVAARLSGRLGTRRRRGKAKQSKETKTKNSLCFWKLLEMLAPPPYHRQEATGPL